MVLKKTSLLSGKGAIVNGGQGVQRKSINPSDRWGFLEEIEAPMWVDLTLEAESMNQDIDGTWFQTTHLFHQCSSRQLISTFSVSGGGSSISNSEVLEPSSPKLPPSVSRSRGKHYKSRKWGTGNHVGVVYKQHPIRKLGGKTSVVNSRPGQEITPKFKSGNPKETTSLKASFVCESSSTARIRPNDFKTISNFGESKSMKSSTASFVAESNLTSTTGPNSSKVAFISGDSKSYSDTKASIEDERDMQQPQTLTEASSSASEFLSSMRMNLRQSCVTRLPSRVEIKDGGQSKGRRSTSSKSSVGSSNTGCDFKNPILTATQTKDKTPESKNIVRTRPANPKGKASNITNTSTIQVLDLNFKSRYGGETLAAKSSYQGALKSKVLYRTEHKKALAQRNIDGQYPLNVTKAKGRMGVTRLDKVVVGSGKVIAIGSMVSGKKLSGKENAVGGLLQHHNAVMKHGIQAKDDPAKSSGSKGKVNGRNEGKNSANVVRRTYFR